MKQKPKNGQHFVALIVGGDLRFQTSMRTALAEQGVLVSEMWSASKNLERRPLPDGVEIVLVVRDSTISRAVRDKISHQAKQRGALVVDAKNMSDVWGQLDRHGYKARSIEIDTAPAPEVQAAQEINVREETDAQKMVRLGAEMRRRRLAMGLTANAVGREIGCSGSYLTAIEKGSTNAKPTDGVLSAVERYFKFASGSFPRLASRQNRRIGVAPVHIAPAAPVAAPEPEPEVVRGPVVDMPVPVAVPRPPIDAGIDGRDADTELVRLHLEVLAIQSRMKQRGIARIELTPTSLIVMRTET